MTMNTKLWVLSFGLVLGMVAMANAGGLTKPRKAYVHSYSTTAALVHAGPGAVYQIVMSTGAASEYIVLFDSGSATGIAVTDTSKMITPRIFYANTASNTVVGFDPPLLYINGLAIDASAATGQAAITYESGRAIGGN